MTKTPDKDQERRDRESELWSAANDRLNRLSKQYGPMDRLREKKKHELKIEAQLREEFGERK